MEKKHYERPHIIKLETGMPGKFGMRNDSPPTTHIDGVAVKELVAGYGSPLFVISESTTRSVYRKAYKAFSTRYPKVQFAWSYKTNYLSAVCNIFHQEGSWAEVVSGFEYDKAVANGVDPAKIIFNGPGKSTEDLRKAAENGSLIHIDHLDELYTLTDLTGELTRKPLVAIRVNMDTGIYPMWDRFGFNYENGQAWDAINKIMMSGKLELVGLHTHIGTFIMSAGAYGIAASKLADLALGIKQKFNHDIRYIDMGGGFTSKNTLKGSYLPGSDTNPSFDDYAEAITSALVNSGFKPDNLPLLILETGRALIDEAGYIITTVIANKRLSTGRRATIIDAGVNLLFTSFWYQHPVTPAQGFSQYREENALYGPLCMNIDCVRDSITLPLLNKGEQLVIHYTGAYNLTQWMQFITLRPKVVLIDQDSKTHIIRESESVTSVSGFEKTPDYLNIIK
ncbi:MAG: diaminopimelate decarboxylase [Bacteroidales bacterium]|nr:diaminopimelate decarboxylase [Bacteroidales bacterium]